MTKEEYKQYLESDYWKGYSYSIIKERNFTCQDCGRSFPGERNKLQVHHLVYHGDIAPWSYKPEELVVLCHECHERRHGIYHPHPQKEESGHFAQPDTPSPTAESPIPPLSQNPSNIRRISWTPVVMGAAAIILLLILFARGGEKKAPETVAPPPVVIEEQPVQEKAKTAAPKKKKDAERPMKIEVAPVTAPVVAPPPTVAIPASSPVVDQKEPEPESAMSASDRIYRKHLEERAREAGVSTEGTDSEISDRIYRKHLEERAREAGVSTEGTDSEISDRIYRKHLEERAREAGVSTEGTDSEISDRIYRKHLEERAKEAGVSTEGTDSEISDRIYQKHLEERAQDEPSAKPKRTVRRK